MSRRWGTAAALAVAVAITTGACGNDDAAQSSVADGKAVFTKAGCGACHTLADAGATGGVGVNFDDAKPNALKVEQFVRNGAPPNMPSFEGRLTDAEIEAVALYVETVTGAEPVEE
ncbi:MAG TPA: cytochrome c [Acidimicrobiales bacterium]|jgi:cytochrome c6|nr:cytochrome c [Acidimicrobiales bacterium]